MKLIKKSNVNTRNDYINIQRMLEPKAGVLFTEFVENTVSKRARRMGKSYSGNYNTLLYHLNKFSELNNAALFTNSINEEFLDDFIVYLEGQNLKKNYIKHIVELSQAMVKRAASQGYLIDYSYDNIKIETEDIPSIYLTMNDISRIYYYPSLTEKQAKIRDLFVVGCLTALRYSDLSTLQKENFSDRYITKITKKTGVKVIIPIHDIVKEIFNKYDGNISPKVTSQHFNRTIKNICKRIGFTELVHRTYTKGSSVITDSREKWELISSHTARRSGATNLYNTGRIPIRNIMAITGHTTEKSFMRYIKTSKEDIASNLSGDLFFRN